MRTREPLPLGYAVDPLIMQSNWQDGNPFRVMNELVRTACGVDGVYEIAELYIAESNNGTAEMRAGDVIAITVDDTNSNGVATAAVQLDKGGQIYVFADMSYLRSAYIRTEDGNKTVIGSNEPYVADAGYIPAGASIGVTVEVNYNTTGCVTIARLNEEKYNQAMALLASQPLKLEYQKEHHIKGTITVDRDELLMTSVPYDEGWTVFVDGKKAEVKAVGDAFIAVDLTAGTHTIEMKFFPRGLISGVIISWLAVAALIFITVILPKRREAVVKAVKNPDIKDSERSEEHDL